MKGVALALVLWLTLVGSMALAEEPSIQKCGPVGDMTAQLSAKWGESPVVTGTAGNALFTWFANETTGTWTATVMDASGKLCILTSGNNNRMVPNA